MTELSLEQLRAVVAAIQSAYPSLAGKTWANRNDNTDLVSRWQRKQAKDKAQNKQPFMDEDEASALMWQCLERIEMLTNPNY